MGVSNPQLQLKPYVPTRNFFALLRWEADHRDNADDGNISSQAGRPPPIVLTPEVNLIHLQRQRRAYSKATLISITPEMGPELS
jgi:hypothetical protein